MRDSNTKKDDEGIKCLKDATDLLREQVKSFQEVYIMFRPEQRGVLSRVVFGARLRTNILKRSHRVE